MPLVWFAYSLISWLIWTSFCLISSFYFSNCYFRVLYLLNLSSFCSYLISCSNYSSWLFNSQILRYRFKLRKQFSHKLPFWCSFCKIATIYWFSFSSLSNWVCYWFFRKNLNSMNWACPSICFRIPLLRFEWIIFFRFILLSFILGNLY